MTLAPTVAARVAHLFDATVQQVLSGEVPGVPSAPPMARADVERDDGEVPGPAGPVPVRWYRPVEAHPGRGGHAGLPALVWAHGGGWRHGGLDMAEADSVAQVVAASVPCVVVSVDYRLVPDHRHPAAVDDVVAVHRAVAAGASGPAVDPARVALGGASAGGHLAAVATLALRDAAASAERAGGGATPAALWLAYPVTDPVGGPYEDRHPDCPPVLWLDRETTSSLFGAYVGADPAQVGAPVVPGRADLAGLPPLLVTTAECDGLAAQARTFVGRAARAGVDVTHHRVGAVLHGYLDTVGDEPLADAALARHAGWLRSVLVVPDLPRSDVGLGRRN